MNRTCIYGWGPALLAVALGGGVLGGGEAVAPPPVVSQNEPLDNFGAVLRALKGDDARKLAGSKALVALLEENIKGAKKPYLAQFKKDLDSTDEKVRKEALLVAVNSGDAVTKGGRFGDQIVKGLSGTDVAQRKQALETLTQITEGMLEHEFYKGVLDEIGSADAAVSAAGLKKVQEHGEDAAPYLADALGDDRPAVKKAAAEALKALGPKAKDVVTDIAFYMDDDDKLTRRLVFQVLESLGPDAADAVDDLVRNLGHEDKTVRRMSAVILKKIGEPVKAATSDIIDLLSHDDKAVRSVALDVLQSLGASAKEGVKPLVELLEDETADADARARAAHVLASIGPAAKDALPALKKHLDGPNQTLSTAVKSAVEKIEAVKK